MPDSRDVLTRNWLRFGAILRALGFDAGPARMLPFLSALTMIDMSRGDDLRAAVHAHFARRRDDRGLLDQALMFFLIAPAGAREPASAQAMSPEDRLARATRQLRILNDGVEADDASPLEMATYSAVEILRHKDFESLTAEEMREVRRLIASMRIPAARRRSRRYRRGGSGRIDLRRLLRTSLRFDGEPMLLAWRSPRIKPRPLVLLCDISGSMERYTRVLLSFAYAAEHGAERVEAFVFATRLTRITRQLQGHDPDAALDRVLQSADDWSGGTRIGEAIKTFNRRFARRVLGHGATVVVISDGWDRGDPAELRAAVARLQRACHRLIWMSPLLGIPDYEPLTVGLQAALPYVDDFVPAHNLASLEALGRLLLEVNGRRAVRRQAPTTASA
ncbi:MAG: VWA domain-containing protein [Candidatus Dormibacteraeota bacterium]|nr:VWA domain-containing protein [Candidatus Dormibacteraeota bacterium]